MGIFPRIRRLSCEAGESVTMDLQALEDKLRIDIDPAFFESEQDFR